MNMSEIFGYLSRQYAVNTKNKPTQATLKNGKLVSGNFFMCNQDSGLMLQNKWSILLLNTEQPFRLNGDDIMTPRLISFVFVGNQLPF